MEPDELETLRGEAAQFLSDVGSLDGYESALQGVGPVPEAALQLPFWSLRRLARGEWDTGRVSWRHWAADEDIDDETLRRLGRYERAGYPVRVEQPNGQDLLRLPVGIEAPGDGERDQIEAYRESVERFADDVVLGTQWGPNAIHDALRFGTAVTLPPPAPEGWLTPPIRGSVRLSGDRPMPRSWLKELAEALSDAVAAERQLGPDRGRMWTAAVGAVRARLDGNALTATERSNRGRARRYLDAAVNRALDAEPVDWAHDRRLADPEFDLGGGGGGDGGDG